MKKLKRTTQFSKISILIAFSLSLTMLITGCTSNNGSTDSAESKIPTSTEIGNTAGNLINDGLVGENGDWIIYNNGKGLYKIKKDGTERTFLSADYAKYINVVDGWVYYKSTSRTGGDNGFFRVALNAPENKNSNSGSTETAPELILPKGGENIIVIGEWIYHTVYGSNSAKNGLYRIKVDGSLQGKLYGESIVGVNVVSDWIYLIISTASPSRYDGIYRMKTDGTNFEPLFEAKIEKSNNNINPDTWGTLKNIVVVDDWIYFNDNHGGATDGKGFYKMKTNGTDRQLVYRVDTFDGDLFNISDDWIYYTAFDEKRGLQRVRVDGTGHEYISESIRNIYILEDWIYYFNKSGDNIGLYKMKFDGTENQRVE